MSDPYQSTTFAPPPPKRRAALPLGHRRYLPLAGALVVAVVIGALLGAALRPNAANAGVTTFGLIPQLTPHVHPFNDQSLADVDMPLSQNLRWDGSQAQYTDNDAGRVLGGPVSDTDPSGAAAALGFTQPKVRIATWTAYRLISTNIPHFQFQYHWRGKWYAITPHVHNEHAAWNWQTTSYSATVPRETDAVQILFPARPVWWMAQVGEVTLLTEEV